MYQGRLRRETPGEPVLADPELEFQRTVARRLVHRAAVAEVFVTDAVVLGEDHFLIGSQWPRDHTLYHPDVHRRSDPLLFAETIRQALVYLAHWHYGVPLSHRFVGYDMDFEITDPGAMCVGGKPLPVELDARWQWTDRRPPRRYGARLEVTLSVGGQAAAAAVCGSSRSTSAAIGSSAGVSAEPSPPPSRPRSRAFGWRRAWSAGCGTRTVCWPPVRRPPNGC